MEGTRTAFGSTGFDSTGFDLVLIPIIRTDFSIAYYEGYRLILPDEKTAKAKTESIIKPMSLIMMDPIDKRM
jgi:hypothetical protein